MKKMLLSFLGVMSAASLLAQTIDICGTVFDENNKPMNGRGLMLTVSGKGMILTGAAYILAGIMAQL
jgi:hypothetical protein